MGVELTLPRSGFHPEIYLFLGTHLRAVYWHDEALLTRVQAAAGEGTVHTFFTDLRPTPRYYVVMMEDWAIVTIEGMTHWQQLLANVLRQGQATVNPYPGLVSPFYAASANEVFGLLQPWLAPRLGDRKIIVTGHSFGSACGRLLSYRLEQAFPGRMHAVIAFGGPRTGNRVWALAPKPRSFRVDTVEDPIPFLPPRYVFGLNVLTDPVGAFTRTMAYYHDGFGWVLGPNGEMDIHEQESGLEISPTVPMFLIEGTSNLIPGHDMFHYCRRIRLRMPAELEARPQRLPRAFLLDRVNREMDERQGVVVRPAA